MYIKSSWERDIELDRLDKRRSIEWLFKSEDSEINKAGEGENLSTVESKLGSEIKPLLDKLKRSIAERAVICKASADSLSEKIGEEPVSDSLFDKSLEIKIYSYSQMYKRESIEKSQGGSNEKVSDMLAYNNKVAKYASLRRELSTLSSIIDGIQDEKEYKLPESFIKELGL